MILAPGEESTEGWEPVQLLILCLLQTEIQAVSKVLLLHNEHIYPSLCSDPSPLCASWLATPPIPHQLLPIVELYCRAEGTVWNLCVYLSMSCGGPATIRVLRCIWYAAWKELKNGQCCPEAGSEPSYLRVPQPSFLSSHRSSAAMQCGINRVEVFTQLRLRHAPRQQCKTQQQFQQFSSHTLCTAWGQTSAHTFLESWV